MATLLTILHFLLHGNPVKKNIFPTHSGAAFRRKPIRKTLTKSSLTKNLPVLFSSAKPSLVRTQVSCFHCLCSSNKASLSEAIRQRWGRVLNSNWPKESQRVVQQSDIPTGQYYIQKPGRIQELFESLRSFYHQKNVGRIFPALVHLTGG